MPCLGQGAGLFSIRAEQFQEPTGTHEAWRLHFHAKMLRVIIEKLFENSNCIIK